MSKALTETVEPRVMELLTMLRYKRPAGSKTETDFIKRYLSPLGVTQDKAGNIWCRVGEDSPIMWSSHTDTVHRSHGMQRVTYGANVVMADDNGGECLGADCTTGIWLMVNMIRAQVPGLYLFHAAEEIGGKGSDYIAKSMANKLTHIRYAIAFDRKGDSEIITHQGFERTASDAFARSLADALNLPLEPSDGGTFTDTANYSRLIPECTNIAVGYYKQHSALEHQDVAFACQLLDAILAADFSKLVCARDPTIVESLDWLDDRDYQRGLDYTHTPPNSMLAYVKQYPQDIADFLEMNGFSVDMIEDAMLGSTPYGTH